MHVSVTLITGDLLLQNINPLVLIFAGELYHFVYKVKYLITSLNYFVLFLLIYELRVYFP